MHEVAHVLVSESTALGDEERAGTRANAMAALRAATRGELHQATVLIAEVERSARGPGSALDRVLARLARATMLAMDDETANARAELMLALQAAAGEAIDTERVMAFIRELGDVVVVTGPTRRQLSSASAIAWPSDGVGIDARTDELRVHGEVRSLKRRSVVRRLLYALARHPARVLEKEALAVAVWGCPYDPLCHDDALKSNVLHLRRLLASSAVTIACGNPGYRLDATDRFVFVAPFDLLGAHRLSSPRHG